MIKLRCRCGQMIKVDRKYAGGRITCPGCGRSKKVPPLPDSLTKKKSSSASEPPGKGPVRKPSPAEPVFDDLASIDDFSDPTYGSDDFVDDDDFGDPFEDDPAGGHPSATATARKAVSVDDFADNFEDDFANETGDEFDDADFADDLSGGGFDDYEEYNSGALPSARKKKHKSADSKSSGDDGAGVPPKVLYSLFGVAAVVVAVAVTLLVRSAMEASDRSAQAQAAPEQFGEWEHPQGGLAAEVPSSWQVESGGGKGGRPVFATFENEKQGIKMLIRESLSGTAISDIVTSGGTVPGDLGPDVPDDLDPVAGVHDFQYEKISAEYDTYEESEPKPVESGFGEGRISEYSASKLLMSEYGLRATFLGHNRQYNVICQAPKSRLNEFKPVFMRVIKSLGPGTFRMP